MKTSVREQKIISILESRGKMSVNDLSDILGVSVSTLRKQLADMQDRSLIIRTYGGVMSINPVPDETFDSKLHKSVLEKRRIAAKARQIIGEGSVLSLGSGTTVYGLSSLLDDLHRGTVYTNSMQAADYLARCASLEVHICGGIIRSSTGTIIGSEACDCFGGINVDYSFISCDAIDDNGDVYSDNLAVATVEKPVILNAKHRYVLCDSSKLGKKSIAKIVSLKSCTALITVESDSASTDKLSCITNIIYA